VTGVSGGPAPSSADLEAAERIRRLQETELERVRERAARWRDGLVGITALISGVLVVRGPESVSGLAAWARWSVGVAMLVAIAAAVAAGVNAIAAAFGWWSGPTAVGPTTGLYERLLAEDRRLARRALGQLRAAAVLTLITALAIAVAVGLSFFAPAAGGGASGVCVRAVSRTGTVTTLRLDATGGTAAFPDSAVLDVVAC